ncbi:MAG: sulfite exporter TauE/SafE family protein [Nitrososphaerota archaeon]|nr:sulfite exporter TauE/SafE family protein [Nitrososphaerota archaeon]MDG6924339.1 sulfite exporter TauE/SafE family protein [Nitrososphaerota archaeon]
MDYSFVIALASVFLISLVFSMFGQGGGSLYTPVLFLLGYATLVSVSTSLVLNLVTALFATFVYYRSKLVNLRLALSFIPSIIVGSFLGGAWSNFVDTDIILWLFVLLLIVGGGRMVYTQWERNSPVERKLEWSNAFLYVVIVLFSFGVGILSGLLGVGGGILIVPFLIFAYKVPAKIAAGTTGFIVIFSSLFGVVGHSAFGHLDFFLILGAAATVSLGAFLGAKFMSKTKIEWIKPGFGVIMLAFAFQLIVKLIHF